MGFVDVVIQTVNEIDDIVHRLLEVLGKLVDSDQIVVGSTSIDDGAAVSPLHLAECIEFLGGLVVVHANLGHRGGQVVYLVTEVPVREDDVLADEDLAVHDPVPDEVADRGVIPVGHLSPELDVLFFSEPESNISASGFNCWCSHNVRCVEALVMEAVLCGGGIGKCSPLGARNVVVLQRPILPVNQRLVNDCKYSNI